MHFNFYSLFNEIHVQTERQPVDQLTVFFSFLRVLVILVLLALLLAPSHFREGNIINRALAYACFYLQRYTFITIHVYLFCSLKEGFEMHVKRIYITENEKS